MCVVGVVVLLVLCVWFEEDGRVEAYEEIRAGADGGRPLHVDLETEVARKGLDVEVEVEVVVGQGVLHAELFVEEGGLHGRRHARDLGAFGRAATTNGAAHVVGDAVHGEGGRCEDVAARELCGVVVGGVCRVRGVFEPLAEAWHVDVCDWGVEDAAGLLGVAAAEQDGRVVERLAAPADGARVQLGRETGHARWAVVLNTVAGARADCLLNLWVY